MNKIDLLKSLQKIGIKPGDALLVHSSFKSLEFTGDPEDVCRSLMEAITENGLVVMPTHSYNFINRKDYGPNNKDISPSITGIIPEIFRNIENVHRSLHPTHSVAAWGKGSVDFIARHELYEAVGEGTPYYKFSRMNGKILMIGCDLEACTMIHEAEWEAEVPYRDIHYNPAWGYAGSYYNENKKIKVVEYKNVPGCSHGFTKYQQELIDNGCLKKISLNNETSYIADSPCLMKFMKRLLRLNPFALLEENNRTCYQCQEAFRRLEIRKSN